MRSVDGSNVALAKGMAVCSETTSKPCPNRRRVQVGEVAICDKRPSTAFGADARCAMLSMGLVTLRYRRARQPPVS